MNIKLEAGSVTEEMQVHADAVPDVDLETSRSATSWMRAKSKVCR